MKPQGKQNKSIALYKVICKQVALFFLLVAFINTIVFPSLLLVVKQSNQKCQISIELENTSSLTEYLLEDYLHVYDSTSDAKEDDVKDLEKLYDEVDLLHCSNAHMVFHQGIYKIQKYTHSKYPLKFFCYNSPTPPPES